MPQFFYKAKNMKGKEVEGVLSAKDKHHLAGLLHRKGYFLVTARSEGEELHEEKVGMGKIRSVLASFSGVSLTDKLFFTRNLEVMIKTGVPLPRAFNILSKQTKNKKFRKTLEGISKKITRGTSLSDSMRDYPDVFSRLFIETVKVGEETGNMENSLNVLTKQMEREHNLKSQIKGAMVYPVMVLSITVVIGVFMLIFVVPKLQSAFEQLDAELPVTTKLILSSTDFIVNNWYFAALIAIFLVGITVFAVKSSKGTKFKSKVALNIPIISKLVKSANSAIALRTLSSLISSGVPIVRSLEIASGSLGNFYFRESFEKASKEVEKGMKLSEGLRPYKDIYSPMVIQMMEVGEETGETSEILEKLASFYEEQLKRATEKLSSVIEPILILFIGAVVGFFAISMMQPMFSIMQGL